MFQQIVSDEWEQNTAPDTYNYVNNDHAVLKSL